MTGMTRQERLVNTSVAPKVTIFSRVAPRVKSHFVSRIIGLLFILISATALYTVQHGLAACQVYTNLILRVLYR